MSNARNKPMDEQIIENKLCFEYRIFHSDDFSTSKFLSLFGKNATLEELKSDLNTYLNIVEGSLNDLINADFQDHITLSSYIIDIFQTVNDIEEPLSSVKFELEKRSADISSVADDLKALILERRLIEDKRKHQIAVRNMQDSLVQLKTVVGDLDRTTDSNYRNDTRVTDQANMAHSSDQAKVTQATEQARADSSCNEDLGDTFFVNIFVPDSNETNKLALFRRAASCVNYFKTNFENCVKRDLPDTYLRDYNQLKKHIIAYLNEIFMLAYVSKDPELAKILNIYFNMREEKTIYNLVREKLVAPHMENIICERYLPNASNDLSIIYNEIISFVDANRQLHSNLKSSSDLRSEFDFLLNSIWPCVSRELINLKLIYVCGNANTFQKRYSVTLDFLEEFECRLSSIEAVRAFRESDDYNSFIKCWNLSVYYQLRFQEIAGQLEKVMRSRTDDFHSLIKSVTDQTMLCLSRCWSDDVFLRELSHKFWRLNSQILSRYRSWCQTILSEPMDPKNKINVAMFLRAQCDNFNTKLYNMLSELPTNKIRPPLTTSHEMQINVQRFVSDFRQDFLRADDLIIDLLTNASVEITRQVNDIHRMYRRTNRDAPRDACPYVGNILAPVVEFKKEYGDCADYFLVPVLSNLTTKYYERVMDLFESMQKTHESLKRFKKIKDPNMAEGMSEDDEKIKMQVAIDVQFYANLIETELLGYRKINVDKLRDLIESTKK